MGATAAVIVASITLVGGVIAIGIYIHEKLENKKKIIIIIIIWKKKNSKTKNSKKWW